MAKSLGANPTIKTTLDRREAVRDADFVIVMVQVGGFDNTLVDFEIPRKYGLNFTIADTTGPGGMMRALRTYPFFRDLVRGVPGGGAQRLHPELHQPDVDEHAVHRPQRSHPRGRAVSQRAGHVQPNSWATSARSRSDVAFTCSGINHMAFYTKIAKDNVDLYPRLFAAMNDPKVFSLRAK